MNREMKDSGIEWISLIPREWQIVKLYNIKDKTNPYPIGDGDHGQIKPSMYLNYGIPYIRVQNLGWNKEINYDGMVYISEETHKANLKSRLKPGDILIAKTGATVGKTAIIPSDMQEANTTSSVGKVSVDSNICDNDYVYYALNSDSTQVQVWLASSQKSAQPGFNIDDLVLFKIPFPMRDEQVKISRHLNKTIPEIERIIEYTKDTVEDYKLLKQSTITEAVTKGLDKNVELKDSGVEWIGEIPKHWRKTTVGKLYTSILGKMLCDVQKEKSYTLEKYLSAINVHFDGIDLEVEKQMWFSPKEKESYLLKTGDLLVVEGGAGAGGASLFCYEGQDSYYIQNSIHLVKPKENASNKYLYYWLYSLVTRGYIEFCSNKATIPHFTKEKLLNTPICDLGRDEQDQITRKLDKICDEIDILIQQKWKLVSDLEAYKKSLIYEYVTGKKQVE